MKTITKSRTIVFIAGVLDSEAIKNITMVVELKKEMEDFYAEEIVFTKDAEEYMKNSLGFDFSEYIKSDLNDRSSAKVTISNRVFELKKDKIASYIIEVMNETDTNFGHYDTNAELMGNSTVVPSVDLLTSWDKDTLLDLYEWSIDTAASNSTKTDHLEIPTHFETVRKEATR